MSKIYVRIAQRKESVKFYRCGIAFTKAWQELDVDAATEKRLREEQMLEVSSDAPADLETDSSNAASQAGGSSSDGSADTSSAVPTDPAVRLAAIKDAITKLDKADPSLWLKNGQPKAEAIAALTGWAVKADERNEAAPAPAK